jgi:4-aminobutyrate aminotransferase/(S)-3-amino-2-methylpropionate transaminase
MKHIQLKTEIPGPKSKTLMERRRAAVSKGPFHSTGVFVESAEGFLVTDVDGNKLIDFACGIGVTNLGHSPKTVVSAIQNQASQFLHTSFNVLPYEEYVATAEWLNAHTPGKFSKKTLLVNSGSEAVENAIKLARMYTKRQAVVCFDHAYHGRTYMAMTLTSKSKPYKHGFGPFLSDVYRVPFPYEYRWPTANDVSEECMKQIEDLVEVQIGAKEVAAVIIEPVQGEGGFIPAPKKFFQLLKSFCEKNGIVFIADEIQSGFGRTGTLFASEQLGVEPDLITLAKGIGSGLPLAAVVGRTEILDSVIDGGVGGTYGGNPVACAGALAGFKLFEDPKTLAQAKHLGEKLTSKLNSFKEKYSLIGDVRGLGPMLGVELVKSRSTKEPYKEAAGAIQQACVKRGLVVLTAGSFGNVLRFLVPLCLTDDAFQEAVEILEDAFTEVQKTHGKV